MTQTVAADLQQLAKEHLGWRVHGFLIGTFCPGARLALRQSGRRLQHSPEVRQFRSAQCR